MSRISFGSSLVAASLMLVSSAVAAQPALAETPATVLLRNGIAGSGNQLDAAPGLAITANGTALTLRKTTLADITKQLGGKPATLKEGETHFSWVCYASPAGAEAPAALAWFASDEDGKSGALLTGVATEYAPDTLPSGCTKLAAPLELETGLPSLSNSQPDIEAALNAGKAGDVEPDGTSSWIYGSEKVGDGINVRETELKFRVTNGRVVAAAVRVIYEME